MIRELNEQELSENLNDLTDILHLTVASGASVGFILPYSKEEAQTFWHKTVLPSLQRGKRILFVAEIDKKIVGTVQLDMDLMPNQSHRGEIAKLLVHPDFRQKGIGKKLMIALESRARDLEKRLLTLDTRTGDTAEPLYSSLGYQSVGVIPEYCRAAETERYDSTTYMYKLL